MKKLLLLVVSVFIMSSGCANTRFLVCGLDVKEMKGKDFGVVALGAVASVGTHIAGHFIAAEIFDVDIHLDGLNEVVDYSKDPSSNSLQWVARGGFVFQLAVNTALVEFANDSYFTKGFTAFTCAELLTYNLRHPKDGDFNLLNENDGNGDLEHGLFLTWSSYNFYRISFKEEGDYK
jgi:hypothetical protein